MKNNKSINETSCPVDYAFKRIGGKYKGRILWHLHLEDIMRYGELRKTLRDITPKMLTQTLRELKMTTCCTERSIRKYHLRLNIILQKQEQSLSLL